MFSDKAKNVGELYCAINLIYNFYRGIKVSMLRPGDKNETDKI